MKSDTLEGHSSPNSNAEALNKSIDKNKKCMEKFMTKLFQPSSATSKLFPSLGHENNKIIDYQTNDSSSRRINSTILDVRRPSNSDMNCKNGIIGYFLFETIIETKVLIHCTCTYALYFRSFFFTYYNMYISSSLWKLISWYLRSQLGVALEVLSYLAKANIDNKQNAWNQIVSLKHSYIDWKSIHCEGGSSLQHEMDKNTKLLKGNLFLLNTNIHEVKIELQFLKMEQ